MSTHSWCWPGAGHWSAGGRARDARSRSADDRGARGAREPSSGSTALASTAASSVHTLKPIWHNAATDQSIRTTAWSQPC
jgi:hypothetical protein